MAKAPKVLILNGPNLNMPGKRQPDVYGSESLADIEASCGRHGKEPGLEVDCRQSNSEEELVDRRQGARENQNGLILSPGACSHTSITNMDHFLAMSLPLIEVHLSNIHRRVAFRHHSYVSKVADAVLCGFGSLGSLLALDAMGRRLGAQQET